MFCEFWTTFPLTGMNATKKLSEIEAEELSNTMTCKQDQICSWYNNAKAKKKIAVNVIINLANGSSTAIIGTGLPDMFYNKLVKPLVNMEKVKLLVVTSVKATRSVSLSISQKHTKAVWKEASAKVKEAVKAKMVEFQLEREKEEEEVETVTEDNAGTDAAKQSVAAAQFLQGKERLELHFGTDLNGHHFNEAYLLFNENVIGPFLEFSKDCIDCEIPHGQALVSNMSSSDRESSGSSETTVTPPVVLPALSSSVSTSTVIATSPDTPLSSNAAISLPLATLPLTPLLLMKATDIVSSASLNIPVSDAYEAIATLQLSLPVSA
ncbi:hypothetical protein GYMLUDRAFT_239028 [Collybiopsis luxurians FD-317 M1]|nr:hypothetical protein GYMLUDRAFT_239028 [Collybiopsis luxurians FD-317 M1]